MLFLQITWSKTLTESLGACTLRLGVGWGAQQQHTVLWAQNNLVLFCIPEAKIL